jgi:hypothetical protein
MSAPVSGHEPWQYQVLGYYSGQPITFWCCSGHMEEARQVSA